MAMSNSETNSGLKTEIIKSTDYGRVVGVLSPLYPDVDKYITYNVIANQPELDAALKNLNLRQFLISKNSNGRNDVETRNDAENLLQKLEDEEVRTKILKLDEEKKLLDGIIDSIYKEVRLLISVNAKVLPFKPRDIS